MFPVVDLCTENLIKCTFIRVWNQISINETMVRTALALCTNSLFFAKNSLYRNKRLEAWPLLQFGKQ